MKTFYVTKSRRGLRAFTLPEGAPPPSLPPVVSEAPPTPAQMQAAWDARLAGNPKLNLAEAVRHGIELPHGQGTIRLAAGDHDRAMFAQLLTLLREAEELLPNASAKSSFRASPQSIADAGGTIHTLSVSGLRSLLVAYGAAYQTLWTAARTSA